ncbi:glutathione S-transferase family protein [Robiginitomaculum antarcticum]|uniref:glutathione S-transferase family protein n=1 Tax=Robiginitomaculum antarcticum TaxID=437507 RepID=UPI0003A92782|nr:glutathione S-transferase [Robiginitomaculum antarcticum]
MITVHHLNNSRSQRILWLLEELGVDYEIRHYERDPDTNRAPAELKAIHPLGKSPVLEDGDQIVAETGAIIVYILDKYGNGRLRPKDDTQDYFDYVHFLHFAEGSAMLPFLLSLYTGYLGDAAAPLQPLILAEIKGVLDYCEYRLIRNEYFAGSKLTGADIQMIFPLEAAKARGRLIGFDACTAFVERIHKRPAYLRALERGGDYAYGPRE